MKIQGEYLQSLFPILFLKNGLNKINKADILKILESVDSSIKDINYTISPTKNSLKKHCQNKHDEEQLGFSET